MKIIKISDIHLNFLGKQGIDNFLDTINAEKPDVFLIGGDIAEATDVLNMLLYIEVNVDTLIYFVLGNHDYYGNSFK